MVCRKAGVIIGSLFLLGIVHLASTQGTTSSRAQTNSNTCHLRELDLCAANLFMFVQSPNGLATSESEINKQCVTIKEAETCVRGYSRRCMTPIHRELLGFATNASLSVVGEYCTKGSQLRTSYLKHATCMNQVHKKETRACMRDLLASLDLLMSSRSEDHGKRLQMACCTYTRFEQCLGGHLQKKCGKETQEFVSQLVDRATSRLPQIVCRQYKPEGQECRALLPKSGTTPKGIKSNSILSRLLSVYTSGN